MVGGEVMLRPVGDQPGRADWERRLQPASLHTKVCAPSECTLKRALPANPTGSANWERRL